MLGYGFIAKDHCNGYILMPHVFWPPPGIPKLIKICGRNREKLKTIVSRYRFDEYCMDWNEIINDDRIEICVNVGSNDIHKDFCIAAANMGKHVVCEKPLARNAPEARQMLEAVNKAGVKHICNFNYRMIPALALAKQLIIDKRIGKIFHFRTNYLMDYYNDPDFPITWRMQKENAGSGTLGDLGVHVVDLARWICGEPEKVTAITKTFIEKRKLSEGSSKKRKVDVDDASIAILEFKNGAIGYMEASTFGTGHKAYVEVEINGEAGSIRWNFEDLNHLYVYFKNEDPTNTRGFHKISVTEKFHPYWDKWSSYDSIPLGWNCTFVHTAYNIVNSVVNNVKLEPMVATFDDGYKAAVICDAILKSSESGKKEEIKY